MSTTTNPRSIDALLALGTYQGMTDEEIDIVLNYKVQQAMIQENIGTKNALEAQKLSALISRWEQDSQTSYDMLESILNRNVAITPIVQAQTVQPTLITNDSTEV